MYFNKYPSVYEPLNEVKKIFRPWDSADNKSSTCLGGCITTKKDDDCGQDATISTTTENEDNEVTKKASELINAEKNRVDCKSGFLKIGKTQISPEKSAPELKSSPESKTVPVSLDYPGSLEGYPLYPEYLHVNLAHSLGLTPTDPLFLECLNQGYTLEEYTRVMSQEQQAKFLSSRKQRPKKYRCPHCDVGFSNNGQLKGHIRIHTGERPFRCEESNCGKTFTRNEELTRHKRIHSGLRPFPCTHCGKRFGRKDHLKKHSRTHFQPRGLYALPVMLPFETWTSSAAYPYVPMFSY